MPTNLYGPGDNYDLQNSHVIPAMIRKLHLAKLAAAHDWPGIARDEARNGTIPDELRQQLHGTSNAGLAPCLTLWGTGTPKREFLYVDDMAAASVHVMNLDKASYDAHTQPMLSHINVGTGEDLSIRELAEAVARVVGYGGLIEFDASKPDGTPRKLLDVSRLHALGCQARVGLEEGLRQAYADFLQR